MNTFTLKFFGVIVMAFLLVPASTHAYRYVESGAVQLSDTTYLLTHTYTAGFLNEDVMTPIVATLIGSKALDYPSVEYSVDGESDVLATAKINALVLSSEASVVDNQYLTQVGERDTFTLLALVTLPSVQSSLEKPSLVIETLPFHYTRDGEKKTGKYTIDPSLTEEIVVQVNE